MAVLVLLMLIMTMAGGSSGASWCVCKTDVNETGLQKTLDYACGAGADCNSIHSNGGCYQPNTVKDHCSYAVNSYFQNKKQAVGSCDFSGTAIVTTTDPSPAGSSCSFPSSASSAGSTPTIGGNNSPFTPNNGMMGGISSTLGPTGSGFGNDPNSGFLANADMGFLSLALLVSGMALWRA